MRLVLSVLCLFVVPLAAQQTTGLGGPPPKGEVVSRVFEVRNQDPQGIVNLLGSFGAQLRYSPALKAIAVSGPPAIVDAVGEAIKRFDVPVRNVELTAYLLSASQQAAQSETVPKELDGVVKQMRSLFTYQGFRLLDTMVMRTREGLAFDMTSLGPNPSNPSATSTETAIYRFSAQSVGVTQEGKGSLVRLEKLRFGARVTLGKQTLDAGISTDLDVREGQKVVVGKTGLGNTGEALILVVTARVAD